MDTVIIVLAILMGCAVGWSIGANDAANSLGVAVGSKVISLRTALLLICIFGFAGALLQGKYVCQTIGKDIVPIGDLPAQTRNYLSMVAAFGAFAWVVLATYWKMPISTSHSIVGAVGGAGLAIHAPVNWWVIGKVFICWIATPVGAAVIAFALYLLLKRVFHRIVPNKYAGKVLSFLIITSGCYVAFTWGANDVANAVGVISYCGILNEKLAISLGGIAIVIGIVTWGYKVIETIGSDIVDMLPLMAFSAQLASAINVHVYTLIGIPVSTSHSIVGAVVGVGLVRGVRVLNISIMKEIVVCWLATPFVSGVISYGLLKLLTLALPLSVK